MCVWVSRAAIWKPISLCRFPFPPVSVKDSFSWNGETEPLHIPSACPSSLCCIHWLLRGICDWLTHCYAPSPFCDCMQIWTGLSRWVRLGLVAPTSVAHTRPECSRGEIVAPSELSTLPWCWTLHPLLAFSSLYIGSAVHSSYFWKGLKASSLAAFRCKLLPWTSLSVHIGKLHHTSGGIGWSGARDYH